MNQSTILAQGTINGADSLTIELVQPADHPPIVRIAWPAKPSITQSPRFNATAAEAMKILAYASTRYTQIRAQRRC